MTATRSLWLALAAALLLAGPAAATTISQKDKSFTPDEITIVAGDSLSFLNDDTTAHNLLIKGPGMNFNSDLQPPGKEVTVRFEQPGTYEVRCAMHPKMKAQVTVTK